MPYYYSPFRKEFKKDTFKECPFCNKEIIAKEGIKDKNGNLVENGHYYWITNAFPRMEGHTMIVPKRHLLKLEDETTEEVLSRQNLLLLAAKAMNLAFPGWGIEIFLQTGEGSYSSVPHLHWHLVPSKQPDNSNSEERFDHYMTKDENEEKVVMYPISIKYAREELQKLLAENL